MNSPSGKQRSPIRRKSSWADRFFAVTFFVAVVVVSLIAGGLLTVGNLFPGPYIARAYEGGKALYMKLTSYNNIYGSDLWHPVRIEERGVTENAGPAVQEGFTLYTSGAAAFLIDADGKVLHKWERPYSTVWPDGGGVRNPQPDSHVYFRKAVLYPNGDLLVVYEGVGDTPYGYGLVKLDKDSNVIWAYEGRAHHDVVVGKDGRIYALTHKIVDEKVDGFDNLAAARIEDYLVILSPEGEELKKLALTPMVARSPYRQMLHTVSFWAIADPLHTNNVDVLEAEDVENFPFGRPGDVMLSFRELGAVGVVDVETGELAWATRGPWIGQHDADLLPSGRILLFDNYGHYETPEGRSRVIEFDPRTLEIVWEYVGTPERPLDSLIRSSQQRLANGNTLITESNGGRIIEVTPEGQIVWEFVNPIRGGPEEGMIGIICWAQRISPDDLEDGFLGSLAVAGNRNAKRDMS